MGIKIKSLDLEGREALYKALCRVRGDKLVADIDCGPFSTCAPVASLDSVCIFISYEVSHDLHIKIWDVSSAYVNFSIDGEVCIEQPTNSNTRPDAPGQVWKLHRSIYCIWKVGRIWVSLFVQCLKNCNFINSISDDRVSFYTRVESITILCIDVDDVAFLSNSQSPLDSFKTTFSSRSDVKLIRSLSSFINWDMKKDETDKVVS